MPENKLQHYVPKCHLRPFCSGNEGAAINLYNVGSDRLIQGAPMKGQCARDYFYGKDRRLERALQDPEGAYATVVAKAAEDPTSLNAEDLAILREFTLLQTFRTYGRIEKLIAMSDRQYADLEIAASGRPVPPRMLGNIGAAVRMSIGHFLATRKHIEDLDLCLVVNNSRRHFITSDDPAILTNRLHLQKLRSESFGLGSSGAMLFLPLSPTLAFMAFDGNVYFAPERQGNIVTISHDKEISPLNELQILHARQNLYFSDGATGEMLTAEFKKHAPGRPEVWSKFMYFEKIEETEDGERYGRVEAMKLERGREYLTAFRFVHIRPSQWTGLLKNRLRPRMVDTRTAAGWIRPNHPMLQELKERRTRRKSGIEIDL